MATIEAPSSPQLFGGMVDRGGALTQEGLAFLEGLWKQVVAGYVIVPCVAVTTDNAIALLPRMHREGGATYADHMVFAFVADATSSDAVTIGVGSLQNLKAYINEGSVQAGPGDVVASRLYFAAYDAAMDSGAGGMVLLGSFSGFMHTLLDDADAAAARATLGLDDGAYTPTLTNTTNLDASTAFACTYIQVGGAVFVAWRFEADATAAAACVMGMSLPVAANFNAASQLNGNGISSAGNAVRITADATNDRAQFSWTSSVTVNAAFNGTFGYIIP